MIYFLGVSGTIADLYQTTFLNRKKNTMFPTLIDVGFLMSAFWCRIWCRTWCRIWCRMWACLYVCRSVCRTYVGLMSDNFAPNWLFGSWCRGWGGCGMGVSTLLPDASHESDVGNRFSNENAVYVCRRDVGMFFCCVFFFLYKIVLKTCTVRIRGADPLERTKR